jgi:hypothetical protein
MTVALFFALASVALAAPIAQSPTVPIPPNTPNPADPYTLAGDFNGDGHGDIVRLVENGPTDLRIWAFISDGVKFDVSSAYSGGAGGIARSLMLPFVGDVDGDGKDEICAWYDHGQNNAGLLVFKWNGTGFSEREAWQAAVDGWDWPWTQTVAADVDGDGADEVCAFYWAGNGETSMWVFHRNGDGFTPVKEWDSGGGAWNWAGTKPVAADVDGNGTDEIWAFYDYGQIGTGLWKFTEAGGSTVTPEGPWMGDIPWTSIRPFAGNLDGATGDEIAGIFDHGTSNSGLWEFKWNGSGFSVSENWKSGANNWDPRRSTPVATDADGDGKAEVFSLYSYGNESFALFCSRPGASWVPFSIWLKGTGAWDAATTPVATSPFVAPVQTAITINANMSTSRIGGVPMLSGSVSPNGLFGRVIVVYVQKPGSPRWTYSSNRVAYAVGTGTAWGYKYTFKRGMSKGTYKFKAAVPVGTGIVGSSSTITSIRVK